MSSIKCIADFSSGHTDVIVTESYSHAQQFVKVVDSSAVLVNASTMFCDGETLGMGLRSEFPPTSSMPAVPWNYLS